MTNDDMTNKCEYQYEDILNCVAANDVFFEMATIATGNNLNINVNPETNRLSIAYFKVLNAKSFRAATKIARLHFKDSGMEYHRDSLGKQQWILNSREIKNIIKLLESKHADYNGYTNWQVACYQWNFENGLINQGIHDYFNGKYDHVYDNDSRLKEAYVPSTQQMPKNGWIVDQ